MFIAIAFLLGLISNNAPAAVLDRLEAAVNSSTILLSDVRQFRKTVSLRSQLDPLFSGTELSKQGTKASQEQIVEFLVNEALILQEFPISDAEVDQKINSIQAEHQITRSTLIRTLKEQGFSFEDYFELIRSSIAKLQLIDRDIRTKVYISEDDLKNFFYNHYSSGNQSASYHIKVIRVHPSNYKDPKAAQDIVNRAAEAVKAGEKFDEIARQYSDDATASNGGDLGTLSESEISPFISKQIKKLKIGQTSAVFGDQNTGYFLVKLEGIRFDQNKQFEKAKDQIFQKLTSDEYQKQIELWLSRKRQEAFVHLARKQ